MKNFRSNKMLLVLFICLLACGARAQHPSGPSRGALIIQGAGDIKQQSPRMWELFISLAGGPDANIVYIPTADDPVDLKNFEWEGFPFQKLTHLTVLHTRCSSEADTKEFNAALRKATGVWFGGGREFRLVDAYLNTRTQREIEAVLKRGGVVGGQSAGGAMLASYLARGGILNPKVLMVTGHDTGFGFLRNATIDQHIDARKSEDDMSKVIAVHPELLGIGLEDSTSIVVHGGKLEVLGPGRVAITDGKTHDGKQYYHLNPGEQLDLKKRAKVIRRFGGVFAKGE
jgi:cyanophycinase